ncbi:MAG: hypothetical protein MZW92_43620 [Comamonadaceae bacterium]|nr:hypothetical protein [Comamonadaceae bacterium]
MEIYSERGQFAELRELATTNLAHCPRRRPGKGFLRAAEQGDASQVNPF